MFNLKKIKNKNTIKEIYLGCVKKAKKLSFDSITKDSGNERIRTRPEFYNNLSSQLGKTKTLHHFSNSLFPVHF